MRIAIGLAGALALGAQALAQTPQPTVAGPPDWSAVKTHAELASDAGGQLWAPTVRYFCGVAQQPNNPADPAFEPVKLFDNLYAVGDRGTVVYVLTTPEGVVLIDSGYAAKAETVLLPGLRAIGVDPAQVKLVLIAHGHADHYGGAAYFQALGAKVAVSAKDWDAIAAAAPPPGAKALRRDLVLEDQKPVGLGGVSITPVAIPGHTPGSMGFVFPVEDRGRRGMAAIFASSPLTMARLTPDQLTEIVASLQHFGAVAARMKVEVELQNHPMFDDMWERVARLKGREAGEPNPFVVGTEGYRRFNLAMVECLRSQLARKGARP